MDLYEDIVANNIRRLINESGYKQRAIAIRAGIDEKTFSQILHGRKRLRIGHLPPIAKALNVPIKELFKGV